MSFGLNTETVTEYLPVILGGLGLMVIVLIGLVINLERRLNRLLGDKQAKTLEEAATSLRTRIKELEKFQAEMIRYTRMLETRVRRSIQANETLRFNPFKGTGDGGNQSFATTFLNENGDGLVLSSLYSRERVSVFSKPVKNFKPNFELSDEEKQTLDKATVVVKSGSKNPNEG